MQKTKKKRHKGKILGVPAKAVAPLALSRASISCLFMTCSGTRPFSLATIGESEPIRAKVANMIIFLHLPTVLAHDLPAPCHCELLLSLRAVLNARRGNPITRNLPSVLAHGSCHCELLLSLRAVLHARRGNLLASRSPHCVRDDKLFLDGFISFAMTTLNLPQALLVIAMELVVRFLPENLVIARRAACTAW